MSRIGLSIDHLLAATWSQTGSPAYAARVPGLAILDAETVAIVGTGVAEFRATLSEALGDTAPIDGARAARSGTLRIHAQQAARAGRGALEITDPFPAGLAREAFDLAVADLAGITSLGVTTVVDCADPAVAALFADRIAIVEHGRCAVAYPVVAPRPRTPADVGVVTRRAQARLTTQ